LDVVCLSFTLDKPSGVVSGVPEYVESLVISNVVHSPQFAISHDVGKVPLDSVTIALLSSLRVLSRVPVSKVTEVILQKVLVRADHWLWVGHI